MKTSANTNTTVIWKGLFYKTVEYCNISFQMNTIFIDGTIVGMANRQPININYQILLDRDFGITSLTLKETDCKPFLIQMTRKNKKWFDEKGIHLEQFDKCDDIDISLTPMTNTIPINRLHLIPGQSQSLFVIYIDPLKNDLEVAQQSYTNLDGGTLYICKPRFTVYFRFIR